MPSRKPTSKARSTASVRAWRETITLPTYEPDPPDRNPTFLEKRVYQGSSGRVYPLPVIDRIAEQPTPRQWQAIWLENTFLKVLVLPEIGGRVHRLLDKTNGYDLIYHQPVIKPALVGLAGPWISGGIEFNWPQHHRPATFMPVDTEIERHDDGSVTVWCGDHDPLQRMKGMHGVCLHPGRAYLELKVRIHNRTPFTQTFLWWANVATRVHEGYQSFFPPDVYYVADHARRSMSEYPLAQGCYYGVDYGQRGRSGIPTSEAPAQYVPPHCQSNPEPGNRQSAIGNRQSAIPPYAPNDLSFYANIPVPTSYMCMGSREDFFGGYDWKAQAGIVHVADHHIAPGKKQWTWGNHDFGYAWDRNLTTPQVGQASSLSPVGQASSLPAPKPTSFSPTPALEFPPYIELMAGVFTNNQPDFSFLQPGETKSWSQFWYPIQQIGPAQQANLDAAASFHLEQTTFRLGISVTRAFPNAAVRLERADGAAAAEWKVDLAPGKPFLLESPQATQPWGVGETVLRVLDRTGREIIAYRPQPHAKGEVPPPATEPPAPAVIASADELFVTGLHLEQYRHATRCPTLYWREALRRDPGDARCNNSLGLWCVKRGEFALAETHFRQAISRLTRRNANPADGEPFYNLGLCLRYQADALLNDECRMTNDERMTKSRARKPSRPASLRASECEFDSSFVIRHSSLLRSAYDAFAKATWNAAWAGPAYHALAELDCRNEDWDKAADHIEQACCAMANNRRAMNLWAMIAGRQDNFIAAEALPKLHRLSDPLDWWTRHLLGEEMTCDTQTLLDLALDYARAGFHAEAIELLQTRAAQPPTNDPRNLGTAPLLHYYLGWLHLQATAHAPAARPVQSSQSHARRHFQRAAVASPDHCFPARLEEIAILAAAIAANPDDARAPYYLGNLLYDRRRHDDAMRLWERSAKLDPNFSIVWRNLGMGHFNVRRQPAKARAAYERAFRANPADARLLYERDYLWKRLGEKPAKRLRELERCLDLVRQRDDLSLELCALYNQVGRPADALALVIGRHFQPWEGGEGGPLGQWVRAHLALGREALRAAESEVRSPKSEGAPPALATAIEHFRAALTAPRNLGEAKHLLANQSDIHYWLGSAHAANGDRRLAHEHWLAAATFKGDFQQMSVRPFSEMSYYSALAWEKLGQRGKATRLLRDLLTHARKLERTEAKIDYFATSLPTMLLFEDDFQFRQETTALFLQAQAHLGLGRRAKADELLRHVLRRDPNHALAADLARDLRRPPARQATKR